MFDTLVTTQMLAEHLSDPGWVIVDCRFSLADAAAGERAYVEGHIPSARYFHLEHDLSGPLTPRSGRHPLPEPKYFMAKLGRMGVGQGTQLVAYDDAGGAFAARLWWLARWLGHPQTAVLDGGWKHWQAQGRPVSVESPAVIPRAFSGRPASDLWLTSDAILDIARGRTTARLLDVRAPARFRGEAESIDPVAGHVPGAVNLPYEGNVTHDGRFHSPEALRRRFEQALGGWPPAQAVCMCGSGVTACHSLLAMEVAGLKGARLYAGSWSEWIRDPVRPVATGA